MFFLLVRVILFNAILCNQDKSHRNLYFLNFCVKILNTTKMIRREYIYTPDFLATLREIPEDS